jgi:hypothetical protein
VYISCEDALQGFVPLSGFRPQRIINEGVLAQRGNPAAKNYTWYTSISSTILNTALMFIFMNLPHHIFLEMLESSVFRVLTLDFSVS